MTETRDLVDTERHSIIKQRTAIVDAITSTSSVAAHLYAVIETTDHNINRTPRQNGEERVTLHVGRDGLRQWLRYGCERVMQIGGQTVCRPHKRHGAFTRPSDGYHDASSCAGVENPAGCLIHDLFGGDARLSQQLVTSRPTKRHLWEIAVDTPQPADIGLIVEAIRYLDSRDVSLPAHGHVNTRLVNPLYDEKEVLRTYLTQTVTDSMHHKDQRWRDSTCEKHIAALREQLAVRDELHPAIYPDGGER
ncbi:hypothetical protein SAMN06264855_10650 [Halorubrum vacuolatum]|uniref:Uncharacterized protein n=1 Tax=Halorubrum vacuolatum TaxID=63740 RepID=A0A238W9U0_HALVU|nr:hypothetical protein SAMN06264855_10650 [Halorubrum vacuolatum]